MKGKSYWILCCINTFCAISVARKTDRTNSCLRRAFAKSVTLTGYWRSIGSNKFLRIIKRNRVRIHQFLWIFLDSVNKKGLDIVSDFERDECVPLEYCNFVVFLRSESINGSSRSWGIITETRKPKLRNVHLSWTVFDYLQVIVKTIAVLLLLWQNQVIIIIKN